MCNPDGSLSGRYFQGSAESSVGMALRPGQLRGGGLGGALLTGSFGDGTINDFDLATGASRGMMLAQSGPSVNVFWALWALAFGNGGAGGRSRNYSTSLAGFRGPVNDLIVEDHGECSVRSENSANQNTRTTAAAMILTTAFAKPGH